MAETRDAHFRTTRWSLVRAAGAGDASARASLEELCGLYWYPLYAFARRRGRSHEEAEDAIQSLFLRLLERDDFAAARPDRGRFRGFLSAALRHHLANERDAARAEKRGGDRARVAVDLSDADARFGRELSSDRTPEQLFERDWALSVLDAVLERLRADYAERDQAELFDVFAAELGGREPEASRAEQAARLGLTEGAWKTALSRARARYRDALRAVVADTLDDPADADEELARLLDALG